MITAVGPCIVRQQVAPRAVVFVAMLPQMEAALGFVGLGGAWVLAAGGCSLLLMLQQTRRIFSVFAVLRVLDYVEAARKSAVYILLALRLVLKVEIVLAGRGL